MYRNQLYALDSPGAQAALSRSVTGAGADQGKPWPAQLLADWRGEALRWTVRLCGGNRDDAEDVLHSVYEKILDGRLRMPVEGRPRAWLFGVLWRTARGTQRRERVRERLLSLHGADLFADGQPASALAVAIRDEVRGELAATVRRLPQRQREVIELVFFRGLTVSDAARVLGIRSGTASAHYHRGKLALADSLGDRSFGGLAGED